ncbi:primary-amine oxidase [Streptomyces sp. WMMC1477]|uniref:primary-amine oxidase n=1 Tax=Streptomyces sp. WMMC1477 TaxID=3015155 RepID=UPI0022B6D92B|nr:primary-amine oxidase [Streptomyces sp. WMMC1477]MCZ7430452.1 primary-amine oxidase [Streptomyces sp. WMMC1477]
MVRHPLEPLTAEEISDARAVLAEAGKVTGTTRFPLVLLDEPERHTVTAHRPGDPVVRRVRVTLLDRATGRAAEALVDLGSRTLVAWRELDAEEDGHPPILFEEYELCDAIVKADTGWRKAMADRGIDDAAIGRAIATPLAAGHFGRDEETGRRMLRSLTFLRCDAADNPFAHPVAGLVADVDLTERRVLRLVDTGPVPVPAECGTYDPAHTGPPRTDLRPLRITQPEGPSFTLDGHHLTWQNWDLRLDFNAREGLVLHQLGFHDGGRLRPVLHRASLAEMAVPYAEPDPARNWVCYLDAGEYLLGRNANSLRLGCDCLGEIRYLDAVLSDDEGHPETLHNAVCLHEEDTGLLWKHTNIFDETGETSVVSRRSRRLVISYITTLGNYDYGFYWYLYQDGTLAFEAKSTGIVQTSASEPGQSTPHATEVAPGLQAPYHQHLFCARLDAAVDGPGNTVEEVDAVRIPLGEDNPNGNAFTARATPITSGADGGRFADPAVGRTWRVVNPARFNRMGSPVAYTLVPRPGPPLLADPASPVARRVEYATRHLWVTRHRPERRYPDGDHPNQHPGGAGVGAWARADEPLENTELTLWHTFGPTHLPRLEDWPVMPVDSTGFTLRPTGFFDRNPALDLPAETAGTGHCHTV